MNNKIFYYYNNVGTYRKHVNRVWRIIRATRHLGIVKLRNGIYQILKYYYHNDALQETNLTLINFFLLVVSGGIAHNIRKKGK